MLTIYSALTFTHSHTSGIVHMAPHGGVGSCWHWNFLHGDLKSTHRSGAWQTKQAMANCTVLWHVDDLKILHADPEVVTGVIKQLEDEFAKDAPTAITHGKTHDYLGMTLDYSINGKVQVRMIDYIGNMLPELLATWTENLRPRHQTTFLTLMTKMQRHLIRSTWTCSITMWRNCYFYVSGQGPTFKWQ